MRLGSILIVRRSIKNGRPLRILKRGLDICQMSLIRAIRTEGGELVEVEKVDAHGFVAGLWVAAGDVTEEDDFVGVEEFEGGVAAVGIVDADDPLGVGFEAAFFADFAGDHFGGFFPDVGPAAGHAPLLIAAFLDEEDPVVLYDGAAYVDLGGGVATLGVEASNEYVLGEVGMLCHDFGGDVHEALVALGVEIAQAEGQPGLPQGLYLTGPVEPLIGCRSGHMLLPRQILIELLLQGLEPIDGVGAQMDKGKRGLVMQERFGHVNPLGAGISIGGTGDG